MDSAMAATICDSGSVTGPGCVSPTRWWGGAPGVPMGLVACDHGACSPWPRAAPLNPKQDTRIQTHICTKPGQWPLAQSFNTVLALIWAHNVMKSSSPEVETQWQRWWPDWHMGPVSGYNASVPFRGQDETKVGDPAIWSSTSSVSSWTAWRWKPNPECMQ